MLQLAGTSSTSLLDKLGAVQGHVREAAAVLIDQFGLTTISGWRSSGADKTGHPAGLALDIPAGRDLGDRVTAWAIENYAALGIKYVIWQQRIWYPAKGWAPMSARPGDKGSGYDPNHLRHVHLSFTQVAPAGGSLLDRLRTGIGNTIGTVTDTITGGLDWADDARRIGLQIVGVVAGLALVVAGTWRLTQPARTKAVEALT